MRLRCDFDYDAAISITMRFRLRCDFDYDAISITMRFRCDFDYNAISITMRFWLRCDFDYDAISMRFRLRCDFDAISIAMRFPSLLETWNFTTIFFILLFLFFQLLLFFLNRLSFAFAFIIFITIIAKTHKNIRQKEEKLLIKPVINQDILFVDGESGHETFEVLLHLWYVKDWVQCFSMHVVMNKCFS